MSSNNGFICWNCEKFPSFGVSSFKYFENTSAHSVKIEDLFNSNPVVDANDQDVTDEFIRLFVDDRKKVVLICDDCFKKCFPEKENE